MPCAPATWARDSGNQFRSSNGHPPAWTWTMRTTPERRTDIMARIILGAAHGVTDHFPPRTLGSWESMKKWSNRSDISADRYSDIAFAIPPLGFFESVPRRMTLTSPLRRKLRHILLFIVCLRGDIVILMGRRYGEVRGGICCY